MRQQDELGRYKCSRCGDYKHFDPNNSKLSEFDMNRRTYKGGEVRKVPMSWCKKCVRSRKSERRTEAGKDWAEAFRVCDGQLSGDDEVIMYLQYRYGEDWSHVLTTNSEGTSA